MSLLDDFGRVRTPRWPLPSAAHFWGWRGLMWDVGETSSYRTIDQTTVTRREASWAADPDSLREWVLSWSVLRDDMSLALARNGPRLFPATEYETLRGFFDARRGGFEAFFWPNPTDNRTEGEVLSASTPGLGADLANPTSTVYQLVRTIGDAANPDTLSTQPVGGMNEGENGAAAPQILVNGGSVDFAPNTPRDGWITLAIPPGERSLLTGTFSYFQRVRFKEDAAQFTTFGFNFWELKKITLREKRAF